MIKEQYYFVILAALVAMGVTFWIMPLLLKFCRAKGYYDFPNGRKVHHCAVPRVGGLVFMPAMLVGLAVALFFYAEDGLEGVLSLRVSSVMVTVGAFLVYIIGTVDDMVGMKANHKFMVQLVAALLMPFCGLFINNFYGMFGLYELPLWFGYPFTVFVILLIVNSINLIDGIDGLASGLCICILVAFVYLYLRMDITMIYAIGISALLGSLAAFFCFNMWGNAEKGTKTFMGDSGSLFLGYALAYLSTKYATYNPSVQPYNESALLVSYTLLIVPTFDAIRVSLFRLYRRRPVFGADKTHIHHVVMEAGFTMHQTWLVIMALFFYFCILNVAMYKAGVGQTWIVFADLLSFVLFNVFMYRRIARRRECPRA